jgi:signal transduction histidine kinase/ligand-binding sensor domain-containing protein
MQSASLRVLLIAAIFLLPTSCILRGEDGRFHVEPVVMSEGLSRATVYTIMQDRHGFLWFGTRFGLVKYDGYGTRSYICDDRSDTTLITDCTVLAVAEDSTGFIWAGTQEGGLVRLNRRTGELRVFRHDPNDATSIGHGEVTSIVVDAGGRVWVATNSRHDSSRLSRFDPKTGRFIRYGRSRSGGVPGGNRITAYIDDHNTLWVCSGKYSEPFGAGLGKGYLSRYDARRDAFETTLVIPKLEGIKIIGESAEGKLALTGISPGKKHSRAVRLFDPRIESLEELALPAHHGADQAGYLFPLAFNDGACWYSVPPLGSAARFATVSSNLYHERPVPIDPKQKPIDDTRLLPRPVMRRAVDMIFTDRSGTVWAATGEGVVKIRHVGGGVTTWRHDPNDPSSLSASRIRAVRVDHLGELWVGTELGLNRYEAKTGTWRRYHADARDPGSLPHSTINAIYEDPQGELWIATNNGLVVYDRRRDRFAPPQLVDLPSSGIPYPWSVLKDRQKRTWIGGAYAGLHLFDSSGRLLKRFLQDVSGRSPHPDRGVWCLFEDSRGTIWAGTNNGLCRWIPESGTLRRYTHRPGDRSSLGGDRVWDISEDRSGDLWISTYGGGISRYNPGSDDFSTTTARDGLPTSHVFGMIEDGNGDFWIGSARGLIRWNRQTGTMNVYDRRDGLQGDEFSFKAFFKAPDGTLYFGGTEGLTALRPEALEQNMVVPPVLITGFYLFDSLAAGELLDGDTIRLPYDQNFFAFDFAALDYISSGRNRHAYMLEGVDPGWVFVDSDHRGATYTGIEPGTYIFRVRGSNNSGVWNERGIAVTVVIDPPWWGTFWFRLMATAAATLVALAVISVRINAVRRNEREKQWSALRTALESQEAERQRIARDLHDGIGQLLAAAGINVQRARELIKRGTGRDDASIDSSLERSLAILGDASSDIRTISHALGTSTLRGFGLAAALRELLDSFGPYHRTRFELDTVRMEERPPEGIETGLFRVAQELVSNVLRHADASEATVQIIREAEEIRMTVEDNGIGFDTASAHEGMGHGNIDARVALMNGRVHYDSVPGHGTTVTVTIPCPHPGPLPIPFGGRGLG